MKHILSSFAVIFFLVLVSFSSSIHMLRESALLGQSDYSDTLYNVFAFGLTGEFMEETLSNLSDAKDDESGAQLLYIYFLHCIFAILQLSY